MSILVIISALTSVLIGLYLGWLARRSEHGSPDRTWNYALAVFFLINALVLLILMSYHSLEGRGK